MIFRTFALFSLVSCVAVAAPLKPRDLSSAIEALRFTADSITRDSAVFWQFPLLSSANTVITDVINFNSEVQTAIGQIPTELMSEDDAASTYRTFVDIYYDAQDGFNALDIAEPSFAEFSGLVATVCGLLQSISSGLHTLVDGTLAVTPEDYYSSIQTTAAPVLSKADFAVTEYC